MPAGQQTLRITITAVDNASKAILKVKNQLTKSFAPARQLGRSLQQFSRISGLTQVGKQLGKVGVAAYGVANQVARATQNMATLVGAGTISGVIALSLAWGKLGFAVTNTANVLGLSTNNLLRFRSAAEQMGISGETATASLKALGDILEDATYGRNQSALVLMKQLGLELHRTAGGAVDAHRAMLDLARLFQDPRWKGNRQAQGLVARSFGVESLLPILLQGPDAINRMEAESAQPGAAPSEAETRRADQFGAVLYRAESAAKGLGYTIGGALIPVLEPLLERFIQWEKANRGVIATKISELVDGLVKTMPALVKDVDDVAQAFGGWKNVAIGLGVVMAINVLGPTGLLVKELLALTATIYARAIPALLALGTAGAASTSVIGGRIAMLGALGGLGTIAFGTGYGIGTLADWGYSKLTGSTIGGDLFDRFGHPEKIDFSQFRKPIAPGTLNGSFNTTDSDTSANLASRLRTLSHEQQDEAFRKEFPGVPLPTQPTKVEIHVSTLPGMVITHQGATPIVKHAMPGVDLP